jgi:hypothetical protein
MNSQLVWNRVRKIGWIMVRAQGPSYENSHVKTVQCMAELHKGHYQKDPPTDQISKGGRGIVRTGIEKNCIRVVKIHHPQRVLPGQLWVYSSSSGVDWKRAGPRLLPKPKELAYIMDTRGCQVFPSCHHCAR